jgi:hypothetical protein
MKKYILILVMMGILSMYSCKKSAEKIPDGEKTIEYLEIIENCSYHLFKKGIYENYGFDGLCLESEDYCFKGNVSIKDGVLTPYITADKYFNGELLLEDIDANNIFLPPGETSISLEEFTISIFLGTYTLRLNPSSHCRYEIRF